MWFVFIITCVTLSACRNIRPEQYASDGYLFSEMQNAVENCETSLAFKEPVLAKDVYDNYIYLYRYDPYVIGLSKKLSVQKNEDDEYIDKVVFNYIYPHDEIQNKKDEMNEMIDSIAAKFSSYESTEDKVSYIYNCLVKDFEYCDNEDDPSTAYSALILRKGSCQSLSKAFILLCEKADVKAGFVVGTLDKIPHIWNYVLIDGTEYQCDLTKGLEEPKDYFLKENFNDNRVCEGKIDPPNGLCGVLP